MTRKEKGKAKEKREKSWRHCNRMMAARLEGSQLPPPMLLLLQLSFQNLGVIAVQAVMLWVFTFTLYPCAGNLLW